MRRAAGVALTAILLAFVGCGEGEGADGEGPEQTKAVSLDESLSGIDSGRIELSLRSMNPELPPRGFEMTGVFAAAASAQDLPLGELSYKQLLPTATKESGFVSDGSRAWVITHQGVTELKDDRLDPLRGGEDIAGLRGLKLADWFEGEPKERPGQPADGTDTVVVSGEVDAPAVINDVLGMTTSLGANVPPPLNPEGLDLVRGAVEHAEASVVVGKEDGLARQISFLVQLPPDREDLLAALGRLYGTRIEFEVNLTEVNQPVTPPAAPPGPAAPTTQPPPEATAPATTA